MPERVLKNRYRLGPSIGEGGMGHVYRGTDLTTGEAVAVKVLDVGLSEEETKFRAFFTRERKALAALQHRSVLRQLDHGEDHGQPFVVTELLDGLDLERVVLCRGGLPDWVVTAVLDQALSALETAHAHDIVHRDIKPSNLFLCRDGRVVVLDFGLARATSEAAGQTLARGLGTSVMGTPHYMAPEMLAGVGLSKRSDLYSLGATAFFLSSGRTAIEGDVLLDVLRALQQGKTRKLRALQPDVDPRLEEVITKLMAPKADDRPAEAAQARRELGPMLKLGSEGDAALAAFSQQAITDALNSNTSPDHGAKALPDSPTTLRGMPRPARSPSLTRRGIVVLKRKAALPLALAAMLILAAAGIAVVLLSSPGEPPAPVATRVVDATPTPPPLPNPQDVQPLAAPLPAPAEPVVEKVPDEPIIDAPPATPNRPSKPLVAPRAPGKGTLSLVLAQWAEVTIDGVAYGRKQFATTLELSEGQHEVVLKNGKYGERKHRVTIRRDGSTQLENDFAK